MPGTRSAKVGFPDSWASVHFDLLRGIAAFLVLIGHWRNLFYIDFSQIPRHRWWFAVPYTVTSVGHQSVVLFFVLSGYFISGSVFRALERNQWDWKAYLLRRGVRLWIVLIPALFFCLLWDKLGIHLGRAPALYTGHGPNHMILDVAPLLAPSVFFGNLFFVQGILTPVFGSDGALWSLANEFWYYILFPLGLVALWPSIARMHRIVSGVLFLIAAGLFWNSILGGFPIWLLGALLFKLPPPSFSPTAGRRIRAAAWPVYFLLFFGIGRARQIPRLISDNVIAVLTFAFLWLLLSNQDRYLPRLHRVRASREFARFSYTLYATHLPFLVFVLSLTLGDARWAPSPLNIVKGCGVILLALAFSFAIAFLTEFRTDALREWLEHRLGMRTVPSVLPSNPLLDSSLQPVTATRSRPA